MAAESGRVHGLKAWLYVRNTAIANEKADADRRSTGSMILSCRLIKAMKLDARLSLKLPAQSRTLTFFDPVHRAIPHCLRLDSTEQQVHGVPPHSQYE